MMQLCNFYPKFGADLGPIEHLRTLRAITRNVKGEDETVPIWRQKWENVVHLLESLKKM